jgi:hypothetical protein
MSLASIVEVDDSFEDCYDYFDFDFKLTMDY